MRPQDLPGVEFVALLQAARHHAQKRTAHAAEQDRPDTVQRRQEWSEGPVDLDPERLVFIDETWASTNVARDECANYFTDAGYDAT